MSLTLAVGRVYGILKKQKTTVFPVITVKIWAAFVIDAKVLRTQQ